MSSKKKTWISFSRPKSLAYMFLATLVLAAAVYYFHSEVAMVTFIGLL